MPKLRERLEKVGGWLSLNANVLIFVAGFGMFIYGVGRYSTPLGFIVAGIGVMAVTVINAFLSIKRKP